MSTALQGSRTPHQSCTDVPGRNPSTELPGNTVLQERSRARPAHRHLSNHVCLAAFSNTSLNTVSTVRWTAGPVRYPAAPCSAAGPWLTTEAATGPLTDYGQKPQPITWPPPRQKGKDSGPWPKLRTLSRGCLYRPTRLRLTTDVASSGSAPAPRHFQPEPGLPCRGTAAHAKAALGLLPWATRGPVPSDTPVLVPPGSRVLESSTCIPVAVAEPGSAAGLHEPHAGPFLLCQLVPQLTSAALEATRVTSLVRQRSRAVAHGTGRPLRGRALRHSSEGLTARADRRAITPRDGSSEAGIRSFGFGLVWSLF